MGGGSAFLLADLFRCVKSDQILKGHLFDLVPLSGLYVSLRHIVSLVACKVGRGTLPGHSAEVPAFSLIHFNSMAKKP